MTTDPQETLEGEQPAGASGVLLASNGAAGARHLDTRGLTRMALKKSDLYRSLWKGADELRGGMDASQYKDYVLTLLFVKYISDRSDKTLLEVPEKARWSDIQALRNDAEIGDKINKIIARIADANPDLHGVIDLADFNDDNKLGRGKEMVDRLSKLVAIFDDLDFGSNSAEGDDLLGDAYEYLMRHFATESGKSKGQFYTPAEVSMILARVVGIGPDTKPDDTVYDPTCGSGALLLKAAHEAPSEMSPYGQEMDNATYALAKMNMILHGYETAELAHGNTLSTPHWKNDDDSLKTFDFAVANPPFSLKAWTNGVNTGNDEFRRFEGFGVPPEKNGDYAFLLHILKSLKSTGKAAVILPHGVLFRGNREADIRRELIKRHLIKGIIGLPANLFYGTGIPACVIVLDKEDTASRTGIFMVDASKGFIKDGNKNRLRAQDIHKIVDVFRNRLELDGYSRLVSFDEISSAANDFNLNLPRYIDAAEPEDTQDLDAHLNGGIPEQDIDALSGYWEVMPTLRAQLFEGVGRPGYLRLMPPVEDVRETIVAHPEFVAFSENTMEHFAEWRARAATASKAIQVDGHPKLLIEELAESLLAAFRGMSLIDPYDIYQHLMDYWAEVMQDDAFQLTQVGWLEAAKLRELHKTKDMELTRFR
jgi:type I restriction enzyme M protein